MRTSKLLLGAALLAVNTLLQAQAPLITNQPSSRVVWLGSYAAFSVGVSGAGPFTYQWQLNGTNLPTGVLTTVAGGGEGDTGQATNASITRSYGVAVDRFGNLFIADYEGYRIRKVGSNGIITTVAGNGVGTYAGDGGPATNASIRYPLDLTVDALGNIFIADIGNDVIRKVSTNGIITTVAGNGTETFSGDGGPATNASLNGAGAVAVDGSGNLYIADQGNGRVRKVNTHGIITTVAGGGTNLANGIPATNASLGVAGVTVDSSGNLFIPDGGTLVHKVSASGIITTVAGNGTGGYSGDGGAATNASLDNPNTVAVDTSGNFWIADAYNQRIRKVSANGVITTVAGSGPGGGPGSAGYSGDGGPATNAALGGPFGLAVDSSGRIFIADSYNSRVREVNTNGIITTCAGNGTYAFSGDGLPALDASLSGPGSVAVDSSGNLFIADPGNERIRQVGIGGIMQTVAGNGTAAYSGDGGPATNASFNGPYGIALDGSGDLFIVDNHNERVRRVGTNGIIATVAGNGTETFSGDGGDGGPATNAIVSAPLGVAVDTLGDLFIVAAYPANDVRKVDTNGVITLFAGSGSYYSSLGDGGPATNATLYSPQGVAVDGLGNVFIADTGTNRVREVTNGIITTLASNVNANGVAPDHSGNLVVAGQNSVYTVSTNGLITTLASAAYANGVAVDGAGDIFVADEGTVEVSGRILKISNTQTPSLALNNVSRADAGNYQVVVTGSGGSVTSHVATLTVATAPLIYSSVRQPGGSVTFGFLSPPNSTSVVLSATNLVPPVVWQPISTNVAGPDGDWQYTVTNAASSPTRFYRSSLP